jgi:CubicO group peptidase (beta-lactamase class C family)
VLSPNAAASLITTAADYASFMTRCMNGSAAGLADMLTPVTRVNRVLSYGLGWGLEREAGAASFWHGGWNPGYKSFALGDVDGRIGVVLLTNSNEGDRINWPVIHQFTGRGAAALVS